MSEIASNGIQYPQQPSNASANSSSTYYSQPPIHHSSNYTTPQGSYYLEEEQSVSYPYSSSPYSHNSVAESSTSQWPSSSTQSSGPDSLNYYQHYANSTSSSLSNYYSVGPPPHPPHPPNNKTGDESRSNEREGERVRQELNAVGNIPIIVLPPRGGGGGGSSPGAANTMMPVRLQNMSQGARTKASMRKLMQEQSSNYKEAHLSPSPERTVPLILKKSSPAPKRKSESSGSDSVSQAIDAALLRAINDSKIKTVLETTKKKLQEDSLKNTDKKKKDSISLVGGSKKRGRSKSGDSGAQELSPPLKMRNIETNDNIPNGEVVRTKRKYVKKIKVSATSSESPVPSSVPRKNSRAKHEAQDGEKITEVVKERKKYVKVRKSSPIASGDNSINLNSSESSLVNFSEIKNDLHLSTSSSTLNESDSPSPPKIKKIKIQSSKFSNATVNVPKKERKKKEVKVLVTKRKYVKRKKVIKDENENAALDLSLPVTPIIPEVINQKEVIEPISIQIPPEVNQNSPALNLPLKTPPRAKSEQKIIKNSISDEQIMSSVSSIISEVVKINNVSSPKSPVLGSLETSPSPAPKTPKTPKSKTPKSDRSTPKTPKSKTPKAQESPVIKNQKTPKVKTPKTPKKEKSPKMPKNEKSPKTLKKEKTPKTPKKAKSSEVIEVSPEQNLAILECAEVLSSSNSEASFKPPENVKETKTKIPKEKSESPLHSSSPDKEEPVRVKRKYVKKSDKSPKVSRKNSQASQNSSCSVEIIPPEPLRENTQKLSILERRPTTVKKFKAPTIISKVKGPIPSRFERISDKKKKQNKKELGPSLRVKNGAVKFYRGSDEEDLEEPLKRAENIKDTLSVLEETDDDSDWVCIFCGLESYKVRLGPLFGPYYIEPKNLNSFRERLRREVWVHTDCALWAGDVILVGNSLRGLQEAVEDGDEIICMICNSGGATVGCMKRGCKETAHYPCALLNKWSLNEDNFQSHCSSHLDYALKSPSPNSSPSKL